MWGPLGGYYAKQSDVDLVVVEIQNTLREIQDFKEKLIGTYQQVLEKRS
jgi:hypothetical protein